MKRAATGLAVGASPAKRQTSLAAFVKRSPQVKAEPSVKRESTAVQAISPDSTLMLKSETKRDPSPDIQVIDETPSSPTPSSKRRKLSDSEGEPKPIPTSNPLEPFTYPPQNHSSYHLPPHPGYNHPFPITPPPSTLLEKMAFNTASKPIFKPELGLDLLYFKSFIDRSCSHDLMQYLLDEMPWYRVKYTVRGININTPRWTTVFGKDATEGKWDSYPVKPRAIPEMLLRLMQMVEQVTGETYNFTLINYYADGTDSISYHSDSESFLGPNPCIASLTLGSARDFFLRHVDYRINNAPIEKFKLIDGDMVVMRGGTQHSWQHSIPKRANVGGRINITFRKGVVRYATKNYLDYNVGKGPLYRWKGGKMVEQG